MFFSLLSKLRIGARLGISFAAVLMLLGATVLVSLARIGDLTRANENLANVEMTNLLLAADVKSAAKEAAIKLLLILSTPNRDQRVPLYREIDRHIGLMDELLIEFSANIDVGSPELDAVIDQRQRYQEAFQHTVELVELDIETALADFFQTTKPALEALFGAMQSLVAARQSQLLAEQQATIDASEQAADLLILLGAAALALGTLLAVVVSRSITRPVARAVEVANRIAGGDLHSPPKVGGNDEIASLMNAFSEMCAGLLAHIYAIQTSSKTLEDSANQLTIPVESVEGGSQSQSGAVSRITQLVAEFAREADIAATAAHAAKDQADVARQLASQGRSLIQDATDEFAKISATISGSAQAVETLSERAASVRGLVLTVREIAEQTNLLALNAAIEAARAGESGRGFSVVADEVRGLANRTEQATSEINGVIDAMDLETKTAVEKFANGQQELEEGVRIIQKMVQPLNELSRDAQASYEELAQLESAVSKQAEESASIQRDIADIGELANNNLAAAREVSHTTKSLKQIAGDLALEVQRYSVS